jgi:hypothetical protein
MAMQIAQIDIKGIGTLLLNNPQTVDRFNKYARRMAAINAKKTRRTDDDYLELRQLEIESKMYFDDGVYVPGSWMMEALAVNGFRVAKLSRDTIRGSLFVAESKLPLTYAGMGKVKSPQDIVMNSEFHWVVGLPQGQVRVMKAFPKFQDWSFSATVEFNGFGDFRPTFGRAIAEVTHG